MAADWTFDAGLVFDDTTLTPSVSAVGQLLNVAGGTVQQVYDLNGNPLPDNQLTTNNKGYLARFKSGIPFGVISFGSVLQPVVSIEALQSGPAAAAAATSAAAAAASATASASSASSAATSAASAAAAAAASAQQVSDYIAGGGGQTGGGLPAGTTLEQIPDGTTRVALTPAQKAKVASLPATFLTIGATAGTAKAGDYAPTPAQIGAVQAMSGPTRIWVRTAAQGRPTTADGALDGDILFLDAS